MTNTNPIIDLLRSFTVRHDPWRVEDALDALTVVAGGHVTGLVQALADEDDELRLLAVEILYAMGKEASPWRTSICVITCLALVQTAKWGPINR